MRRTDFAGFHCSLARTLDVIGDTWTPLVLRDLMLGLESFEQLVRDLGVSRALLSERLAVLVAAGVVERTADPTRPTRHRYRLTPAGDELRPVLVALTQWGDRWRGDEDGPPIRFRHRCGEELHAVVSCAACGGSITDGLAIEPGPGQRAAPGTMLIGALEEIGR